MLRPLLGPSRSKRPLAVSLAKMLGIVVRSFLLDISTPLWPARSNRTFSAAILLVQAWPRGQELREDGALRREASFPVWAASTESEEAQAYRAYVEHSRCGSKGDAALG